MHWVLLSIPWLPKLLRVPDYASDKTIKRCLKCSNILCLSFNLNQTFDQHCGLPSVIFWAISSFGCDNLLCHFGIYPFSSNSILISWISCKGKPFLCSELHVKVENDIHVPSCSYVWSCGNCYCQMAIRLNRYHQAWFLAKIITCIVWTTWKHRMYLAE